MANSTLHGFSARSHCRALPAMRPFAWLLPALAFLLTGCSLAPPDGVEPVKNFEADRYLGRWYEVARLDHRFERGLTSVTAEYSRGDDGAIVVVNRGYKASRGEWESAEGKAYFQGDEAVGSLKVSFFGPFYGGYHIMALDREAPDYGYSLVSGPSRNYLWVLSRTPTLPEETLESLLALAEANGFDLTELIRVDQTRSPERAP